MTGPIGRRHLVLVGLSGAGKTEVGCRLATFLGTRFTDLDDVIGAGAGAPITRIFADQGEAGFRRLEREAMERALGDSPHVIATGGGWAAQAGNLQATSGKVLVVHLRVSPAVAARRLGPHHCRPLLEPDPASRLEELAAARAPWYARADVVVETDGLSPETVATRVLELARVRAGW